MPTATIGCSGFLKRLGGISLSGVKNQKTTGILVVELG
jgi:hypothetical protein